MGFTRAPRSALLAVAAAAALFGAAAGALAQERLLTLDDIYDPPKRIRFGGQPPTDLAWIDDRHYLVPRREEDAEATPFLKVEALTGRTEPLIDVPRFESALRTLDGVTAENAKDLARQRSHLFDKAHTALVLEAAGDLVHYDLQSHRVRRLTRTPEREEEPSLSPDGRKVAFVRGNDLYVVTVREGEECRLTADGSADVLNGKLDWVYQEEIYGRGNFRGHWWSPDSSRLAFLRLDEKQVPRYTLVDDIPTHPTVTSFPYPKAGDPNPSVRLAVARVGDGATTWIDIARYAASQPLVVDVSWRADAAALSFQVQDREQTWLELNLAEPADGRWRTLLRETSPAWVEVQGSPRWLGSGGFVWLSQRSGFRHLYLHDREGRLLRPLTSGDWEVRKLYGVDPSGRWVYFSATERSPIGPDVYRVATAGGPPQRLSSRPGTHDAVFSPSFSLFLDTWSDVTTPPQVRLHRSDGAEARVVDANPVPVLAEFRLARPEFVQVPTRDGFPMEAMLLKPPGFDPRKRYPVYQHTYGGPQAPQVKNAWGGSGYMFHQLLAQKGIVVWICDNRAASGKGVRPAWSSYQRLGQSELRDIEDGIDWLERQGWVDPARIGISGWSYGGYVAAYALTHSRTFRMGIAGAPVVDWRDYDTIYTERYMRTPANNPEGYRASSALQAAADLHGQLFLVHGTDDENVHPQNTHQLAYELQKAGRPFRMMLYPKSRHGIADPALVKHLRAGMLDFIEETLLERRGTIEP